MNQLSFTRTSIGWQWRNSITWRWVLSVYGRRNVRMGLHRCIHPNGGGFITLNTAVGCVTFWWQNNMWVNNA